MAHSIRRHPILVNPKKSGRSGFSFRVLLHTAVTAVRTFLHQNTVLAIALAAAFVTSLVIPPDAEYL